MTHDDINKAIVNRELFTGNEESTYYNLYDYAVDHYDDPYVLFKLSIYGYYKGRYKWTKEQADWFIEHNLSQSVKHSDGRQEYLYDWGKGKNSVTDNPMHFPHLDHIIPKEQGGTDDPKNMRIRCKRLNESKSNINSDRERRAVILDNWNDMDLDNRKQLLEDLAKTLVDK
jgi:hypothetical protein